jgi:GDPmannose 4,6-dehydratase
MQWLMLQQDEPEDFVIATGIQVSVRRFVEMAAAELGIGLEFKGEGEAEVGVVSRVEGGRAPMQARRRDRQGRPALLPARPRSRRSSATPRRRRASSAGRPRSASAELVREMVESDFASAQRDSLVKQAGFQAYDYNE